MYVVEFVWGKHANCVVCFIWFAWGKEANCLEYILGFALGKEANCMEKPKNESFAQGTYILEDIARSSVEKGQVPNSTG